MKTDPTVAELRAHIKELTDAFGIQMLWHKGKREQGRAGFGLTAAHNLVRVVEAFEIDDETGYAVVMHEIGHHLAPNGMHEVPVPAPGCHPRDRFAYREAQLIAEEAAWEWARYYVEQRFVWTAAMESVRRYGYTTYEVARRTGK